LRSDVSLKATTLCVEQANNCSLQCWSWEVGYIHCNRSSSANDTNRSTYRRLWNCARNAIRAMSHGSE
ncbi:hypothetical protein TELCIR_25286, partial [Teladorsagia circumcincta]